MPIARQLRGNGGSKPRHLYVLLGRQTSCLAAIFRAINHLLLERLFLPAHLQRDGLTEGMNYDPILYTQAEEIQTHFVLRSTPESVVVRADPAQVVYRWREEQMSEGRNLAFNLAWERGR